MMEKYDWRLNNVFIEEVQDFYTPSKEVIGDNVKEKRCVALHFVLLYVSG